MFTVSASPPGSPKFSLLMDRSWGSSQPTPSPFSPCRVWRSFFSSSSVRPNSSKGLSNPMAQPHSGQRGMVTVRRSYPHLPHTCRCVLRPHCHSISLNIHRAASKEKPPTGRVRSPPSSIGMIASRQYERRNRTSAASNDPTPTSGSPPKKPSRGVFKYPTRVMPNTAPTRLRPLNSRTRRRDFISPRSWSPGIRFTIHAK